MLVVNLKRRVFDVEADLRVVLSSSHSSRPSSSPSILPRDGGDDQPLRWGRLGAIHQKVMI